MNKTRVYLSVFILIWFSPRSNNFTLRIPEKALLFLHSVSMLVHSPLRHSRAMHNEVKDRQQMEKISSICTFELLVQWQSTRGTNIGWWSSHNWLLSVGKCTRSAPSQHEHDGGKLLFRKRRARSSFQSASLFLSQSSLKAGKHSTSSEQHIVAQFNLESALDKSSSAIFFAAKIRRLRPYQKAIIAAPTCLRKKSRCDNL